MSTLTCPSVSTSRNLDEILGAAGPAPAGLTVVPPAGDLPSNFPSDSQFALLTVRVPEGFFPTSGADELPGISCGALDAMGDDLVPAVNQSDWAKTNAVWAVQPLTGGLLLLGEIHMSLRRRPIWPDALLRAAEPLTVETAEQARAIASERNTQRLAESSTPGEWTMAVRNPRHGKESEFDDLDSVQSNPLAERLVDLYRPIWERIEADVPDSVTVGGADDIQRGEDGKHYALDDERLYAEAEIQIDATLFYDLRGDIEANVADALREYAHELLDAADRLQPSGSGQGQYLVVEGARVLRRFKSLSGAGGFQQGFGGGVIAEVLERELATVGNEGAADVPA